MAFKTDWSFLDKISMGAIGTETVIDHLNRMGHQVIELERYCTSNKIWSTKIKRVRIPDLLCLRCGRRIESRAKSKLGIIMSDSEKEGERRWFSGLRDTDWVAFVQCFRDTENRWCASDTINLFSVGGMRETEAEGSATSARKSAYEGFELDRRWKTYIPTWAGNGTIVTIEELTDGKKCLRMQGEDGKNHSHKVAQNQYVYVDQGESFSEGAKILTGVVPPIYNCGCSNEQYDFFADLDSTEKETVYTAVKALGYLPASDRAINELRRIAREDCIDTRVRLEAYASLLKLEVDAWEEMYQFAFSLGRIDLITEYVLILGEITSSHAAEYLFRVLQNTDNPEELRAAAVWSLAPDPSVLSRAFPYCFSNEQVVANHTMAKVRRHFCDELTEIVLDAFCEDEHKNAICAFLLSTSENVNYEAVVARFLTADQQTRDWILYTIGISAEEHYADLIERLDHNSSDTKAKLMLLWKCQPAFLTSAEMDSVAFLEKQK